MTAAGAGGRAPLSVLFATSEFMPLAKTGGLGDVSAALPAALARLGVDVRVVLPAYPAVWRHRPAPRSLARARVGAFDVELLETTAESGLPLVLVANGELFDRRGTPYQDERGHDFADNADRFGCFAHAIAWLAAGHTGAAPDIVHLNDWPTALAAALLAAHESRPRTVFSIHNLEYQGLFDRAAFDRLALPERLWSPSGVEYYGGFSFIKAGLAFAYAITTVSATYAAEIQTPAGGFGLDGLLRARADRLVGIANGIDVAQWDPALDRCIAQRYSVDTLAQKTANRDALQRELSLASPAQPLFGIVSRLVHQKGMDLVLELIDRLVALPAQLVVLGSGERALEAGFAAARRRHPSQIAFVPRFDEGLAHRIEAGADIFLMPSRFEPSGLNQMYSMRYGTVPIARRTGGLADTIVPADAPDGTGFLFDEPSAAALWRAVEAAAATFADPPRWRALQRAGMERDFSWTRSARAYLDLYRRVREAR